MIIFPNRDAVIKNIQKNVANKEYNKKVEIDDPQMTTKESINRINEYFRKRATPIGKVKNLCARAIYRGVTWVENRHTEVVGLENLTALDRKKGAIITTNHFNPLENTVIRRFMNKAKLHKRLFIISQDTNLAMKGLVGFLMNNYDIIPLSKSINYLGQTFPKILKKIINDGNYVLIYPEEEMWFNYRKPRPLKRGTYFYAAKINAPIISCFVELKDLPSFEPNTNDTIHRVKAIVHVLPVIFPDPNKSAKENSLRMMEQDYNQKKEAYEKAYGKKLTYDFEPEDIAGWVEPNADKK
nr:lysophospholipid acyltransferase family protein [uncultured Ligilactobacillus sp.]